MHKLIVTAISLMMATEALAQEAGAPPAPSAMASFLPLIIIVFIMYFLIIRPQSKMKKQHEQMVQSLKRGDVVITAGGIRGTVTRVDDNNKTMTVEIAPGVEVTLVKSTVVELEVRKGDRLPANDAEPAEKKKEKK